MWDVFLCYRHAFTLLEVGPSALEVKVWHLVVNVKWHSLPCFLPPPPPDHPTLEPQHIVDEKVVNEHHQDYMFLDCIKFINEVGRANSAAVWWLSSSLSSSVPFYLCCSLMTEEDVKLYFFLRGAVSWYFVMFLCIYLLCRFCSFIYLLRKCSYFFTPHPPPPKKTKQSKAKDPGHC